MLPVRVVRGMSDSSPELAGLLALRQTAWNFSYQDTRPTTLCLDFDRAEGRRMHHCSGSRVLEHDCLLCWPTVARAKAFLPALSSLVLLARPRNMQKECHGDCQSCLSYVC